MRTYLILKERAKRWNKDADIQALLDASVPKDGLPALNAYSSQGRDTLLAHAFNRAELSGKRSRL